MVRILCNRHKKYVFFGRSSKIIGKKIVKIGLYSTYVMCVLTEFSHGSVGILVRGAAVQLYFVIIINKKINKN